MTKVVREVTAQVPTFVPAKKVGQPSKVFASPYARIVARGMLIVTHQMSVGANSATRKIITVNANPFVQGTAPMANV